MVSKTTKDGRTIPDGYYEDQLGNIRSFGTFGRDNAGIGAGKIHVSYHYLLEEGKTTLRGEHKKLETDAKCVHKERLSCNYGEGFARCDFMKYIDGHWECTAKKATVKG